MDSRLIALAVPIFFVMIGIEILLTRKRADVRYRFHDALSSLSCGVGQQALGVFFVLVEVGAYTFVYEHFRLASVSPKSAVAWVVLLFGVDLGYYAYHRASHRVNFFWATHSVHHQSEEYNLSTALRQSWFTGLTVWVFYAPLAVAGFPPVMFIAMHTFNTLYQFWIHTRLVGPLGWIEGFLNTPSHHRVHHGIDPKYIDKNYAGIFIVWDKLFGTFAAEEGEPVYGTVKPLSSWNAVWANVEPWVRLAGLARRTRRVRDKLAIWWMPPDWLPDDSGGPVTVPEVRRADQHKYATPKVRGVDAYAAVGFVLVSVILTVVLGDGAGPPSVSKLLVAVALLLALAGWGGLFEARRWAVPYEWARLAASVLLVAWLARGSAAFVPIVATAAVVGAGLAVWVGRIGAITAERG